MEILNSVKKDNNMKLFKLLLNDRFFNKNYIDSSKNRIVMNYK